MNNILTVKSIVSRNLKDYKFCPKLTKSKANEIVDTIKKALPTFEEIAKDNLRELVERDVILDTDGVVLYDKNQEVAINFFQGEHLSIMSCANDFGKDTFENIKRVSQELNTKINFAYSDQYGYLMSDVSKLGSGIALECEMSLPAINSLGKINQLANNMKRLGYTLKSTDLKDVYIISTKCNLGMKEQQIYDEFEKMITNIQNIENESLSILKIDSIDELIDQTYRAVANLKYAHMITSKELMNIIVKIQIGKNLDLEIKDIDNDKLASLIKMFKHYSKIEESKQTMINLSQEISKVL